MLGWIEWRETEERARVERIGGARFLAVTVVRGSGLRAALSQHFAARYLRRSGVTRAVFPSGCSAARFAAQGIEPVEAAPLRAALAAEIALCALEQEGIAPEGAAAALCAARVTREVETAAETLARRVRYLILRTEQGGWALARALRRSLGVAVTVEPPRARTAAEVTVYFDAESAAAGDGRGLALFDPTLRVDYAAPLLAAYPAMEGEQLLAALCAAQTLRRGEVTVRAVHPAGWSPPETRRDGAPSRA